MAVYQKVFPFVSLKASIVLITSGFGALYVSVEAPNQLILLGGPMWVTIYTLIAFNGIVLAGEAVAERKVKGYLFTKRWLSKKPEQMKPPSSATEAFLNRFNGGMTKQGGLFMGKGFLWRQNHVQMLYDIDLDSDLKDKIENINEDEEGLPIYQAVGGHQEKDIYLPFTRLPGHVGVEGTTRVGKSRLLESVATQQIEIGDGCVSI